MRRIVHISDLHFGALRQETIEPILDIIARLAPHTLVVSGDLTQRATSHQFQRAAEFVERIPCRQRIVVPGNHDVPLWNVWTRFTAPRRRFDACFNSDAFPTAFDHELAVVGLDTARSLSMKNGRVSLEQIREVLERFRKAPPRALRVLTCHHPFIVPEGVPRKERAGRADMALAALVQDDVDLLLTGHRHVPWVSALGTHLPTVHAGTSTSSRIRGLENSFNDIVVETRSVTVCRYLWHPKQGHFAVDRRATRRFHRAASGRIPLDDTGADVGMQLQPHSL